MAAKAASAETRTHSVFSGLFAVAYSQHLLPCVSTLSVRRRCLWRLLSTVGRAVCPTSMPLVDHGLVSGAATGCNPHLLFDFMLPPAFLGHESGVSSKQSQCPARKYSAWLQPLKTA